MFTVGGAQFTVGGAMFTIGGAVFTIGAELTVGGAHRRGRGTPLMVPGTIFWGAFTFSKCE